MVERTLTQTPETFDMRRWPLPLLAVLLASGCARRATLVARVSPDCTRVGAVAAVDSSADDYVRLDRGGAKVRAQAIRAGGNTVLMDSTVGNAYAHTFYGTVYRCERAR